MHAARAAVARTWKALGDGLQSNAAGAARSPAADAAGGGEKQQLAFEAPPQPLREHYVQNVVKFLAHPKVRGSAVVYRHSFLQNKGLTADEIDEAFRRVPDPPTTTTSPLTQTQSMLPPPPLRKLTLQQQGLSSSLHRSPSSPGTTPLSQQGSCSASEPSPPSSSRYISTPGFSAGSQALQPSSASLADDFQIRLPGQTLPDPPPPSPCRDGSLSV